MIEVNYSPKFLKKYKKVKEDSLKKEIEEKIKLFRDIKNRKTLNVHKLKVFNQATYSFSVNYKDRIVFQYLNNKNKVVLLSFGDHNVYKK